MRNPFLDLYPGTNLYARLKKLYAFDPFPTGDEGRIDYAVDSCRKRARLLDELEDVFKSVDAFRFVNIDNLTFPLRRTGT